MNIFIEKTYAQWSTLVPITTTERSGSIEALMTTVVGWISLLVGILAFIYLIYSGILYITAAGNPDQAKKGQQGIVNAIIGVVICIMAYTIVSIVANKVSGTVADTLTTCTKSPVVGTICDPNCKAPTTGTIFTCK